MSVYDRIQKQFPVAKAELNIIIVLIIGLTTLNIFSYFNSNKPSSQTKQEIIAYFDSLTESQRLQEPITTDSLIVDIRTADKFKLQKLSGIGPKTAIKILEYRQSYPFQKTSDLMKVKGIGPKTYAKIKPNLIQFTDGNSFELPADSLSKKPIKKKQKITLNKKININTASINKLKLLPGIGNSYAQRIVEFRENSPFKSIEDLKKVKGIGEKKFEKLKEFVEI
ncbi:ComEA family DNA-binding protein [Candidatus Kapabacteria bacterium]|nr:ComEA family DNA-binding protein [Candidatus Kapabacteria bacterium]